MSDGPICAKVVAKDFSYRVYGSIMHRLIDGLGDKNDAISFFHSGCFEGYVFSFSLLSQFCSMTELPSLAAGPCVGQGTTLDLRNIAELDFVDDKQLVDAELVKLRLLKKKVREFGSSSLDIQSGQKQSIINLFPDDNQNLLHMRCWTLKS